MKTSPSSAGCAPLLRTGWHLENLPRVSSHLVLINACVHVIREGERIIARQLTLTGAPSPRSAVKTADIDQSPINVISL